MALYSSFRHYILYSFWSCFKKNISCLEGNEKRSSKLIVLCLMWADVCARSLGGFVKFNRDRPSQLVYSTPWPSSCIAVGAKHQTLNASPGDEMCNTITELTSQPGHWTRDVAYSTRANRIVVVAYANSYCLMLLLSFRSLTRSHYSFWCQ